MESSRRPPFDRSSALNNSVKKQRLSVEDPRKPSMATGTGLGRFRASPNETVGEVRGAIQQVQQYQELVNQYKTALAELTFNSKPIITNLTIIAGENSQAARAIAATICSHILEVPSEQKLPSLYLLDSIVKNIGSDYIKHFATRLPEVFCKTYRQVDPSIHSSMRHLFGTWKGVFPPQQLRIIEVELGFATAVNGSSSGSAASKTDSQTQRQPHSIHVNPKYLQDRQRLQQANQPKVVDISGVNAGSSDDGERPNKSSLQKPRGVGYGDYEFASGAKRPLSTSLGKSVGQGNEKQWFGASGEVEESISTQRNGYDVGRGISKYTSARAAGNDIPSLHNPPRSSIEVSKSWKHSEEEEYRWDDLGNGATDPGPLDKLDFSTHSSKWTSLPEVRSSIGSPSEPKELPFAQPRSSTSLQQVGTRSVTGLSNFGISATAPSGAKASVGHQRPPSPSISKRDPRQSLIEKDFLKSQSLARTDPRTASISGQPNTGIRDLPSRPQNSHQGNMQKTQSQTPQKQPSASEQSNVSNLLAAVMKSGLITGGPVPGLGIQSPATNSLLSRVATVSPSPHDSVGLSMAQKKLEKPPLSSSALNLSPLVSSASGQTSKNTSVDPNPLSILSTLISKGLISAPKGQDQLSEQNPTVASSASVTLPPVLKNSAVLSALTNDETSTSETVGKEPDIIAPSAKGESDNPIGFDFKPPILRKFHSAVIDKLSDNLPHSCDVCGLRFKLHERLAKHSEWHAFKNSVEKCSNLPSRRWYSNSTDWIAGNAGFPFGYNSIFPSSESSRTGEDNEKMVPADESQCVCLLCGELFEDFYSQERDEWMFKGAVYIPNMSGSAETGPSYESGMHKMIVHCNCMSDDAVRELGLVSGIKVEKNT